VALDRTLLATIAPAKALLSPARLHLIDKRKHLWTRAATAAVGAGLLIDRTLPRTFTNASGTRAPAEQNSVNRVRKFSVVSSRPFERSSKLTATKPSRRERVPQCAWRSKDRADLEVVQGHRILGSDGVRPL
jgi:hypothetical protein